MVEIVDCSHEACKLPVDFIDPGFSILNNLSAIMKRNSDQKTATAE